MENERLARVEESSKQAHKRIDTLEKKIDNITDLTISVKEIASETKAMREDLNKMDDRVKYMEEKPAKNWDKVVGVVIAGIVTAVLGFFLGKFGL